MFSEITSNTEILVNVGLYLTAILLVLADMIVAVRKASVRDLWNRLLLQLFAMAIVDGGCSLVLSVIARPQYSSLRPLVVSLDIVAETALNLQLILIFFLAMYEMFQNRDYLRRRAKKYAIEIILLIAVPFINLFTKVFWTIDANNTWHYHTVYYVYNVFRYLFLIGAVAQYVRFRARERRVRRFKVWLLVVPMLLGTLAEGLTGYGVFALGAAVGYTNLVVFIALEMAYTDYESGLFNLRYLSYIQNHVRKGTCQLSSIMTFKLRDPADVEKFAEVILSVSPEECDTIRTGPDSFITVSESGDRGYVYMLREDVTTMAEEAGFGVEVDSVIRKKNETPVDFFHQYIKLEGGKK